MAPTACIPEGGWCWTPPGNFYGMTEEGSDSPVRRGWLWNGLRVVSPAVGTARNGCAPAVPLLNCRRDHINALRIRRDAIRDNLQDTVGTWRQAWAIEAERNGEIACCYPHVANVVCATIDHGHGSVVKSKTQKRVACCRLVLITKSSGLRHAVEPLSGDATSEVRAGENN